GRRPRMKECDRTPATIPRGPGAWPGGRRPPGHCPYRDRQARAPGARRCRARGQARKAATPAAMPPGRTARPARRLRPGRTATSTFSNPQELLSAGPRKEGMSGMVETPDLVRYLDELLGAAAMKDYCPNGMQVEGA